MMINDVNGTNDSIKLIILGFQEIKTTSNQINR